MTHACFIKLKYETIAVVKEFCWIKPAEAFTFTVGNATDTQSNKTIIITWLYSMCDMWGRTAKRLQQTDQNKVA